MKEELDWLNKKLTRRKRKNMTELILQQNLQEKIQKPIGNID